jgi:transposase
MGTAFAITRLDLTASGLREAATEAKDVAAARRMLCLAMVLDGADRTSVAETWGMDRQTLRDWAHRYNAEGLPGLYDRKGPGARPKLTAEQRAALAAMIEAGPDPAVHGLVRWRRVDLRDELQRQLGVALHERSVGKVLKRRGYRRLSVRPRLPPPSSSMAPAITSPKTSPFAENITLIRLPPRAPELNPMENVWDYPRATSLRVPGRNLIPRCALHCSASASSPTRPRKTIASICYTNLPQR